MESETLSIRMENETFPYSVLKYCVTLLITPLNSVLDYYFFPGNLVSVLADVF